MSNSNFSHKPKVVDTVNTKHRSIVTKIPVPESISILENIYRNESDSMHGQMPVVWDKAKDFNVFDSWGNKWIDFTSTIFVSNAGHGNEAISKAILESLDKPLLHTYTYASEERNNYLSYLIENTPDYFEKAFLLSAGTEATEAALKLMRLNAIKNNKRKPGIICFEGNWHGRTMGAQLMSSNESQKAWIGYRDPNIHHLPFPYPWDEEAINNPKEFFRNSLDDLISNQGLDPEEDICGFMLETFQGWGALFYPEEFVQEIKTYCNEIGALLSFDEMQSGFGRTGKLFGYMHYGVEPDLICCGKGTTSSLPLSIVLGSSEIMDLAEVGSMSSTHSANPMCCAAGLANLKEIIERDLVSKSHELGLIFHKRLSEMHSKFPNHISSVEGKGMIAALHFNSPEGQPLSDLCNDISISCLEKGLLVVNTGRESIKLGPPLIISEEALLEGLDVLEESIKENLE